MALSPGEKLGPYEILAPIGAGGMGEVYKARDTRLNRDVAIKVSADRFTERFEREARAIAALNHPNICHLYDVGPNYLVMELVDGKPLKGPLPVEKAIEYAKQILDALDEAHRHGVVYRDLKPANILVTKSGVKLLDFGLAKMTRPSSAPVEHTVTMTLTAEHTVIGTPQYMAPEQIEGKEADARTDIFAFGCVLYELLTGKPAFEGKSASSIMAAVLATEPVPVSQVRPTSPPALDRIVHKCLVKDPDERFQAASDARWALDWAMETRPIERRGARAHWPWAITGVAVMLAALLAFIHFREIPAVVDPVRFQIQPPEQNRFGIAFALSPDGRKIAFPASGPDGRIFLWIRSFNALEPRLLPGTEDGCHSGRPIAVSSFLDPAES